MKLRKRRIAGWVVASLALLVAVWASYRALDRLTGNEPDPLVNAFLIPALSIAVVVLAAALAGLLIRNLVRLVVERKRGILGSRLRMKLVFFFLALLLVPALVLFSGSAQVIKESVDAVLRTPMADLERQSREIVDQWSEYFQAQALRRAGALAREVEEVGDDRTAVIRVLDRWRMQDELQVLRLARHGTTIARSGTLEQALSPQLRQELDERLSALVEEVGASHHGESRIDYLGSGLLAHAAVPLPGDGVVAVGLVLPTRLAGNLEGVARANEAYRRFRAERREIVQLYLTLIGLIFLLLLFVATWVGFYLARRITEPLRELAAAAREISAGNLGVRVRTTVGDEMGMLVDAFNDMASELQENREVITRSTADLRSSNRALEERRRYIETLLANLSTAVLSLDDAGRVTTVNPAVAAILGVRFRPADDAAAIFRQAGLAPLAELLDAPADPRSDSLHRDLTLDGESGPRNVAVQVSPLRGGGGERLGTLMMVEDLTELLRAQKAAAWREVARRIAHEIKNPLTPIQLSAQRLRKKFAEGAGDLDRVVPEATASIEREVGALKRLVDEFSRFARMPEVAPADVDLPELIDSVLSLYAGHADIDWRVEVDPQLGRVRLDAEQMRRVLINLIDNAVAAMNGRGTITLIARSSPAGDALVIEVADSGPGIPAEDRDTMFSPYLSTKARGTGLGLAIVHKVVTDHQGTIAVENNAPHGARFVIRIPA